MKHLLLLVLFASTVCTSQENFTFNQKGLTDYVVSEVPGLSQSEIYLKTIKWVKENYKNPEKVLTMTMENEKIRVNGFKSSMMCTSGVCSDGNYIFEVSFKDGKYKIDPIKLVLTSGLNSYTVDLNNGSVYYNKKGELTKSSAGYVAAVENHFNEINNSLTSYLKGDAKNSDW